MLAAIGRDLWVGVPIVEKVIRTIAVYGGLVVLLRLGGKRDLAQFNSFDLVVLLLLSNAVQNAIIGNETTIHEGLIGAAVLVAVNGLVVRVVRRHEVGVKLFEGTSEVLVQDGEISMTALHRLGLRRSDVELAIRKQGADAVDEVACATLEPGGAIIVKLRPEEENPKMKDLHRVEQKLDAILAALGDRHA